MRPALSCVFKAKHRFCIRKGKGKYTTFLSMEGSQSYVRVMLLEREWLNKPVNKCLLNIF